MEVQTSACYSQIIHFALNYAVLKLLDDSLRFSDRKHGILKTMKMYSSALVKK
jgi:hypothetical protein